MREAAPRAAGAYRNLVCCCKLMLECMNLPGGLLQLTVGDFPQMLEIVSLSSGLQELTVGYRFELCGSA